jgi:hypothetical protein
MLCRASNLDIFFLTVWVIENGHEIRNMVAESMPNK